MFRFLFLAFWVLTIGLPVSLNAQDGQVPRQTPKKITIGEKPVEWPMRMAKGRPVPVIKAKVNGKGPFLFYLDTGAGTVTLNKAFVEEMKFPKSGTTSVRGPGKGPGIKADIVTVAKFQLGDLTLEDFEGASFDRSKFAGGEDLVGSVGLGIFGDLPVTMDFPNRKLVIGGKSLGKADGKNVLKCDFDGPVPFFEVTLGNVKQQTAFDSGFAGFLLVGEKLAKGFKFQEEPKVVGRARTVSGEFEIKRGKLDGSLVVGNLQTDSPFLTVMPEILTDREISVLGHAWAKNLAVTYDAKNKRIRFWKPEKQESK